jgi:hypothetical protein
MKGKISRHLNVKRTAGPRWREKLGKTVADHELNASTLDVITRLRAALQTDKPEKHNVLQITWRGR